MYTMKQNDIRPENIIECVIRNLFFLRPSSITWFQIFTVFIFLIYIHSLHSASLVVSICF